MALERWAIDGWDLNRDNRVQRVESRDGLYRTAPVVGNNSALALRSGELWRPKNHGPGGFVLNIWLGSWVSHAESYALFEDVLRACGQTHREAKYQHWNAAGEERHAWGEVVAAMEPTMIGQRGMRMSIEVSNSRSYWFSGNTVSQTGVSGLTLYSFAKSTAPMDRLTFKVRGSSTNPKIIDTTDGDGDWVQYLGTVPSGKDLIIDCDTFSLTGSSGFTPDESLWRYSGGVPLVVPVARPGAAPSVRLEGGGQLTVSGPLAFQTM